jgi:hypothetical protein
MTIAKKIVLGAALLLALGLGLLGGTSLTNIAFDGAAVPAAYADPECDNNFPPPPGVLPCATPTPTPMPPQ